MNMGEDVRGEGEVSMQCLRIGRRLQVLRCACLVITLFLFAFSQLSCAPLFRTASRTPDDGSIYGGEVVVGITQEPTLFDPHTVVAAGDEEIIFNIFEGLVKCTPDGHFEPALAIDYSISEDAMTYTFLIRSGVRFHNGEVMTREDVVYSIRRAAGLDTGTPLRSELSDIQSVTLSGENEVNIVLTEPDAELLPFLNVAIIPRSVSDINDTPIGTGPFKFSSYRVSESVILVRNDDYWQEGIPYLNKVTFKITADMNTAFMQLRSGSIDIFPYLDPEKTSQLTDDFQIISGESDMIHVFALNNAVAPFDNPKVREAMNYAVDRESLISLLMSGEGTMIFSGMSPAMGSYYNESLENAYRYDPGKAVELLEQAGFPDGFQATVTVPSNYAHHVNAATIIADQLRKVGVELTIVSVDWATWLEKVYTDRDYQSTVIALTSEFAPRDVLNRYVSDAHNNFIGFNSKEYDRIFSSIRSEPDEDERILAYRRLQEILVSENASVFFQDPRNIVAVRNGLIGYVVYPVYVQDLSVVHYEGAKE